MALNFLKKRWQKLLFIATLTVFVLISIPVYLINKNWSPVLAEELRSAILTGTDSLYSVSFENASVKVLQGKLIIDKIELKPNLDVYNRRKKQHLAPNTLYQLEIKRLVIHHIHPYTLYSKKKLDINQIVISEPNLHVVYEQNRDQDTVLANKKTPYQLISKMLRSVHVQNILLNDVRFKYTDHNWKKTDISEMRDLNFNITDFLLDSVSQFDKSRFFYCRDVSAELMNFEGVTANNRYQYKIKSLKFSTQSSQLNASGLSYVPIQKPVNLFETTPDDCFALRLDSLQLNHFDFKLYNKYHKFYASAMRLVNGKFEVFTNPAPNDTTKDVSANFPQLLLQQLKIDVRLDTVELNRTNIFYTGYYIKSEKQGTVSFNNTNGKIFNVTNNKAALQKNNRTTAELTTYLMNYGKLDVQFIFNLTDPQANFWYKGHMGAMDLKKINPVAMPLGLVKISSGKLDQLDFDMHADRNTARGITTALYENLNISLLKKDNENKLKRMGIFSLLANTLVIKRDNPSENEAPRSFNVIYHRKKSSGLFGYMWKSLFMGLKSTAGYDAATESTVKKKMTDFQNGKAERKANKILRKQHRAERRLRREQRKQDKEAQMQP